MDFKFIENSISKKWIISSPRRANRPDIAKGSELVCPFCLSNESKELEAYRVGGKYPDANWQIRVIPNKFPFASIHEIVIHSPDHHKNFDELPLSQNELILKTYRQRFQAHHDKGQVYIFHNHGQAGGESLPHPHSQIAVIPDFVKQHAQEMSEEVMRQHIELYVNDYSIRLGVEGKQAIEKMHSVFLKQQSPPGPSLSSSRIFLS